MRYPPRNEFGLTASQAEVLAGICANKSMKEIAGELGIGESAAGMRWRGAKRALGVNSYVGAVLWALKRGLLKAEG